MCQRRNQKGNKKYLKTNLNGNTTYQNIMRYSKNRSKRKVYSKKCLCEEKNLKKPSFTPQQWKKQNTKTKSKIIRRKEIIMVITEINE